MKSMLPQQTPVRFLLKMRPLAIASLDRRKIRYWDSLDKPLGDLFRHEVMEDFLDEVSYARIPAPDSDWSAMPLYALVDYLTHEHRSLMLQEVADIAHLLDVHALADSAASADLRKLQADFQNWVRDFQANIDQEEGYLFPKILRYEACLRDRNVHPEFHLGSIQTFMANQDAKESKRFYGNAALMAQRMQIHEITYPDSIAARELSGLFERLRDKLNAQYELKATTLYTAARELERSMYNKSIDGDPAVSFPRRGPMDSGIMRLNQG